MSDGWEDVSDPTEAKAAIASGADKGVATLSPEAFLSTLPAGLRSQVTAIGNYDMPLPTSMRGNSGQIQQAVAQAFPNYDFVNAQTKIGARKAFLYGKQGQNRTVLNTVLGHIGEYAHAIDDLGNTNIPAINAVENSVLPAIGDSTLAAKIRRAQLAKQAISNDLSSAFKGGGAGDVHSQKAFGDAFNLNDSLTAGRQSVQTAAGLIKSRLDAMADSYQQSMGSAEDPYTLLNPHARAAIDQILSQDYLDKGTKSLSALPLAIGSTPQDPGSTPPPPSGPTPPPSGTAPAPDAPTPSSPGGATVQETARNEVSDKDRQDANALEAGINSGVLKTPEEALAFAAKQGRDINDPAFAKSIQDAYAYKAKGGTGYIDVSTPTVLAHTQDPDAAGTFGAGLADAVTFGTLPKLGSLGDAALAKVKGDSRSFGDIYDQALAGNNALLDRAETNHPLAALGGNVAGFLTGDAALGAAAKGSGLLAKVPGAIRPALGDALYGGLYGAGSSDSLSDVPSGVLKGAALGAAGGALGRGVVKGAAALASPIISNAAVRNLTAKGVTLTPGQILGGAAKNIEDKLMSFNGIGDFIRSGRRSSVEDFNRAAINDALQPIGETAAGTGHLGIADMQQKASAAIDNALTPISATVDHQLASDVQAANTAANSLSDAHQKQYDRIISDDVEPYLKGSTIEGSDIKAIKQGLDGKIANLRGQGSSPQDRDLADALDKVKDSFLDFADRADPSATSEYAKARQAYAASKRVSLAASKSNDGVFTPNQFKQAISKRGFGTTTDRLAAGQAPMQQLSRDANEIIPSTVSDSGTAGRAALGHLLMASPGAALGGTEGYRENGLKGALVGAAIGSSVFSKPGLRATQYALAGSRGKTLNTLGSILRANANLGGAVGTPLLLQGLSK